MKGFFALLVFTVAKLHLSVVSVIVECTNIRLSLHIRYRIFIHSSSCIISIFKTITTYLLCFLTKMSAPQLIM